MQENKAKFYNRKWRFLGSLSIIEKDEKEGKKGKGKKGVFWGLLSRKKVFGCVFLDSKINILCK